LNPTDFVKDRLQGCATELTPAERKLAAELMRGYPVAGLQSITRLAEAAGTSTPTVVRLARKLGYDGFSEMQSALRDEASVWVSQPSEKGEGWSLADRVSATFGAFARSVYANLGDTIARLDPATFDAIARLLADPERRIVLLGGRITRSNADYFFNLLQIIRPGVALMPQSPNVWLQYLLDFDHRTVLVIFDMRRYEPGLAKVADLARARGAAIVLFTDMWGSPIAKLSECVVNASVEAPSSWDSTLGLTLVVEALVAEVQARRLADSRDRIDALEDMRKTSRLY